MAEGLLEHRRSAIVATGKQMPEKPKTMSVPDAGRTYFSLGRNASYAAAARGDIPTIKIGSRLRVPVVRLERLLAGENAVAA